MPEIPESEQMQMHTWMDATLREISEHIQRDIEVSRKRDTQLEFSLVYQDYNGNYRRKHLGSVKVGHMGGDDLKNLNTLRYKIGDFLSVAIIEPKEDDAKEKNPVHQQQDQNLNRQRTYHQVSKNDYSTRTSTRYERSDRDKNKPSNRP
jgi:Sin3 associated polypeptide p18 (SAP18)